MTKERFNEIDEKLFKIELWAFGISRVIFGAVCLLLYWISTPDLVMWARVISMICIAYLADSVHWGMTQLCVRFVLKDVSPQWREIIGINDMAKELSKK